MPSAPLQTGTTTMLQRFFFFPFNEPVTKRDSLTGYINLVVSPGLENMRKLPMDIKGTQSEYTLPYVSLE